MAISIRNPRVEDLAREISKIENQPMTQVILEALEEKKERMKQTDAITKLKMLKIEEIVAHISSLPVLDDRSADEVLGYNEIGGF